MLCHCSATKGQPQFQLRTHERRLFVLLLPRETVCLIHSKTLLCHCLVFRITARHFSSLVTNTITRQRSIGDATPYRSALYFLSYSCGKNDFYQHSKKIRKRTMNNSKNSRPLLFVTCGFSSTSLLFNSSIMDTAIKAAYDIFL